MDNTMSDGRGTRQGTRTLLGAKAEADTGKLLNGGPAVSPTSGDPQQKDHRPLRGTATRGTTTVYRPHQYSPESQSRQWVELSARQP